MHHKKRDIHEAHKPHLAIAIFWIAFIGWVVALINFA